MKRIKTPLWVALFFASITRSVAIIIIPTVTVVTNTADSGPGSFRQAILMANASVFGPMRIEFNIPGPGPYTIRPTSPLPIISKPVTIDGTTQPGFAGRPIIELNGELGGGDGLIISGGNSTVQGLVINGMANIGILLNGSGNNVIRGNFIGTDVSGTRSIPNFWGINVFGVSNNRIGGTNPADRNIISGNRDRGINFYQASVNRVLGNLIGTDVTGTKALGNGYFGIILCCAPATNNLIGGTVPGAGNVISGNDGQGIQIESGASGNLIQGNFVGPDVTGRARIGNRRDGILIFQSDHNLIGGTTPGAGNLVSGNGINGVEIIGSASTDNLIQGNLIGTDITGGMALENSGSGVGLFGCVNVTVGGTNGAARNVISGNAVNGLVIATDGGSGAIASANQVHGNYIGTDRTGIAALGNGEDGIFISAGLNNVIGGTNAGARNVISANGRLGRVNDGSSGVEIWDGASGNSVLGNLIGTDVNGTNNFGNREYGVFIQNSSRNTIGGAAMGAGNMIAFNQKDGVYVQSGTNDLIRGNPIFANSELGIDLGTDGVTPNDASDSDAGANNLQNHPVLTSALANLNSTTISGKLLSRPNASYTVEFFANVSCDPPGHGEGQRLIGLTNVTTAATGSNFFTVTFINSIPVGHFVTATATDAATNTSEFSACVQVMSGAPAPPYLTSAMSLPNGAFQFAFTNSTAASFTVLASTNLSLPSSNWVVIGSPMPIGGGVYQFTDTDATTHQVRFYQLRWP